MGWPPREEEGEGVFFSIGVLEKVDGHVGLGVGFITIVGDGFASVFKIDSTVGMMIEVIPCPVSVEPEAVGTRRCEGVANLVVVAELIGPEVPFANVGGVVVCAGEGMAEAVVIGAETQFVDDHAVAALEFTGKERGAIGGTDGGAGGGIDAVEALRGEAIHVGGLGPRVSGETAGEVAELIGKEVDEVGM